MNVWLGLLIPSVFTGLICAYFFKGRLGVFLAGAIPWFGFLAWNLYQEYFVPYEGGGASMWLVAQLFAGTIAAGVGVVVYLFCKNLFNRVF